MKQDYNRSRGSCPEFSLVRVPPSQPTPESLQSLYLLLITCPRSLGHIFSRDKRPNWGINYCEALIGGDHRNLVAKNLNLFDLAIFYFHQPNHAVFTVIQVFQYFFLAEEICEAGNGIAVADD